MTLVDSSQVSLLGIEALELYGTATVSLLDDVPVEMVGEDLVSFVGENFSTIFTFNAGNHSFSRTFGSSHLPLPLENFVAFFIKVFFGLPIFHLPEIVN